MRPTLAILLLTMLPTPADGFNLANERLQYAHDGSSCCPSRRALIKATWIAYNQRPKPERKPLPKVDPLPSWEQAARLTERRTMTDAKLEKARAELGKGQTTSIGTIRSTRPNTSSP